jgi:hypothetical protein
VQTEQVALRPAKRLRLRAPGRKEAPAVLYGLPPAIMIDVDGAATVEDTEDAMQSIRPAYGLLG